MTAQLDYPEGCSGLTTISAGAERLMKSILVARENSNAK
jgi:hypothetical protein